MKKTTSIPAYKTTARSKVISLPKTFKNFFETRDGQGNIVVSVEPLKQKFKALYLVRKSMYETRKGDCDLWCHKQRAKCIYFLLATTEQPLVLNTWTHYYKNQSIIGKLCLIKEQYPTLATFIDDFGNDVVEIPALPMAMYDTLCQVVGKLEEISHFCDIATGKCEEEISICSDRNGQPKKGNCNKT